MVVLNQNSSGIKTGFNLKAVRFSLKSSEVVDLVQKYFMANTINLLGGKILPADVSKAATAEDSKEGTEKP